MTNTRTISPLSSMWRDAQVEPGDIHGRSLAGGLPGSPASPLRRPTDAPPP